MIFFFFQAEDGIRDIGVTGVQTCALPIFLQGLAFVIPESTALDTFTAESAPIDIEAPVEQPLEPPGAITFTGVALPEYQNVADFVVQRSEEHTSELQSRQYLVCRLLLEKK